MAENKCKVIDVPKDVCTVVLKGWAHKGIEVSEINGDKVIEKFGDELPCQQSRMSEDDLDEYFDE